MNKKIRDIEIIDSETGEHRAVITNCYSYSEAIKEYKKRYCHKPLAVLNYLSAKNYKESL
jgi:hypothetical protein